MDAIQGQVNRTPEPANQDFAVMWPIMRNRLETNSDEGIDTLFTASITGNVMTVSAIAFGVIEVGNTIFGAGVADNTKVVSFGSGSGGVGTYNVSTTPDVISEQMACGVMNVTQPTELVMQVDVHGPNSSDNIQAISTMFRDPYGTQFFNGENVDITPLFASDPRMAPFINAEQQIEVRYIIELHIQVNQTIVVPQQFAGAAAINVISVEAAYPP
jgi:hypothetical protein